jgi:hypothetical protein
MRYNLERLLKSRNPLNPKKHDINGIVRSIREHGFASPVIVDRSGTIVCGHGRVEALRRMKISGEKSPKGITRTWKVPIVIAETDNPNRLLVQDNALVESGKWNIKKLSDILDNPGMDGVAHKKLARSVRKSKKRIPKSKEIKARHNYLVLTFSNDDDWLAALDRLGVKVEVRSLHPPVNYGIGRVIDGKKILELMR